VLKSFAFDMMMDGHFICGLKPRISISQRCIKGNGNSRAVFVLALIKTSLNQF